MFDIGFSELVVIGVVALVVIGPERLPKVARTAGHLMGRFQRYAASVKADISREMELDELRKAGEGFKESVQSSLHEVQSQTTVVDDYLKNEIGQIRQTLSTNQADAATADSPEIAETSPQQSLDLSPPPATVIEYAQRDNASHA
jgi:sec-independent protein translocase protein TatB